MYFFFFFYCVGAFEITVLPPSPHDCENSTIYTSSRNALSYLLTRIADRVVDCNHSVSAVKGPFHQLILKSEVVKLGISMNFITRLVEVVTSRVGPVVTFGTDKPCEHCTKDKTVVVEMPSTPPSTPIYRRSSSTPTIMLLALLTSTMSLGVATTSTTPTPKHDHYIPANNQSTHRQPVCEYTCKANNQSGKTCHFHVTPNPKGNFTGPLAESCWCHKGYTLCDGCFKNGSKPSNQLVVTPHKICIIFYVPCTGPDEGTCHHTWSHPEVPLFLYAFLMLLCGIVLTVLMILTCIYKSKRNGRYTPRILCRFNPLIILLVMLMNAKTVKSIWPGQCDGGVCLVNCYDVSTEADKMGEVVVNPTFKPQAGAFCLDSSCCEDAGRYVTVWKCRVHTYGWSSHCFTIGEGCFWCGYKIEGNQLPVYQMKNPKRMCTFTANGVKFTKQLDINVNSNPLIHKGCVDSNIHVYKGNWRVSGNWGCDCKDPWHCGVYGGINLESACHKTGDTRIGPDYSRIVYEDVPLNQHLPKCANNNLQYPCVKNGKICLDTNCNEPDHPHFSTVSKVTEMLSYHTDFNWDFPPWFPGMSGVVMIVMAIMIFVLLIVVTRK